MNWIFKIKKVNIQVPFNGCDEWMGILLCLVLVPHERHRYPPEIEVYSIEVDGWQEYSMPLRSRIGESYCKFESRADQYFYFFFPYFASSSHFWFPCSASSSHFWFFIFIAIFVCVLWDSSSMWQKLVHLSNQNSSLWGSIFSLNLSL